MSKKQTSGAVAEAPKVDSIDPAGVQLLLALNKVEPQYGVSVEFRGESAALSNALAALGLQGAITMASSHDAR